MKPGELLAIVAGHRGPELARIAAAAGALQQDRSADSRVTFAKLAGVVAHSGPVSRRGNTLLVFGPGGLAVTTSLSGRIDAARLGRALDEVRPRPAPPTGRYL